MRIDRVSGGFQPEGNQGTHVVKEGETMSSIAEFHQISTESLARANSLPIDAKVSAGDQLIIPFARMSDQQMQDRNAALPQTDHLENATAKMSLAEFLSDPGLSNIQLDQPAADAQKQRMERWKILQDAQTTIQTDVQHSTQSGIQTDMQDIMQSEEISTE